MREYFTQLVSASYLQPHVLWLLPLAVLLVVYSLRKRPHSICAALLRMLSLTLLLLALARPVTHESESQQSLVALLDVSASVPHQAQQEFLEKLRPLLATSANTSLRVIPFARELSRKDWTLKTAQDLAQLKQDIYSARSAVDTGKTDIGAALESALSRYGSASLLLLSDGFETGGNAERAARAAAAQGVGIYPLFPPEEMLRQSQLSIAAFDAPLTAQAGDRSELRATLRNALPREAEGRLEIYLGNERLFSSVLNVPAQEEKLVVIKTPPLVGGLHRLRAVLTPSDNRQASLSGLENHRWLSVKSKEQILLLSGTVDDARVLSRLLAAKGYATQNIIADQGIAIPTDLSDFPTVILNNIPRSALPGAFLDRLKSAVERGAGLLLVGGDRSFGLGGYINTALESISPLKFVPPTTTKRRLNAAVVLVIDKSRSMAYEDKIESAKRAAILSIDALKDDDFISVIGFDSTPFVIIRLAPVPEVKPMAMRRLANLTPAGRTNLLPALAAARQALKSSEAGRKHLIILSDGKVPYSGDEYVNEISRLRADKITVSAVALGMEADVPFMKLLSDSGGGAFYHTLDPTKLPEIFLHDIKVSVGEQTMKEQEDFPVSIGSAGLKSTTVSNYPALRGFVETTAKTGASIELFVSKGQKNYPLLASWSVNNGKVIAFTSDANGRWSSPWLRWTNFVRFWDELLESIKSTDTEIVKEVHFDLRYSVNRGALNLDLAVFDEKLRSQAAPSISLELKDPTDDTHKLQFQTEVPGRFSTTLDNAKPGDYQLNISYGQLKLPPLGLSLSGDLFGEKAGQGLNLENLSRLASLSGGKLNPNPQDLIFNKREQRQQKDLFPPLVLFAFILILSEAFIRELGLPSFRRPPSINGIYRRGRQGRLSERAAKLPGSS